MSSSSIVKSLSFQLVMISFARRIQLNLRLLLRFLFAFLVTIFVLLNLTTLSVDNRIPVNLLSKGSLLPVASSRYKRIPEPNTATLDDDDFSTLLNITDFRFDLNQPQKCKSTELFMLIFIHSAVGNFEKRNTIRKTWGNDQLWNKSENPIRIVFMVGESGNATIDKQLKVENNNYNDIIQGNFKDSYHNITYKHVMGLKWVTYFCSNAKYIFKSDDDIFVDPIQLIYYLKGTIGQCPKNLMACYVNPHSPVFRGYRNKWRVGFREYPDSHYPKYCAGWGVIMSQDVVFALYRAARNRPFFWIDDVFITGILAQDLNISHVDLRKRVSIEKGHVQRWLESEQLSIPPLFGLPDSNQSEILQLWNKTVKYYQQKFNTFPPNQL